jgi:hypothetical protein
MAEETTIIPLPLLNPVPDAAFIYAVHNSVDYKAKREDFVNQNNLDLFVNIYTNISLSSQAQLSYINTQTFVVGETQTLWMRIIQFEVIAGFDEIRVVALYKHILGKGTYGNTGTAISYSNLEFITTYAPTAADYQNAPTTETIVIEDLGGLNVSQFVNAKNPFYVVKAISEGRTLFATPSGIYLFKLAGGNYGVGGITTTTLADYELLSETATPPTIDAEVLQNSTNAVSGGGVYDFVQPTLEKTLPITTDSFTILDSVDSKRKKLTFDNLINYVKVFIDNSLALFKTTNFLDATSSIQTQINSALNRTFAQLVGSAGIITNSARIYWINGLFNSSINQESLDFTFYNQPNNQYRSLTMNSGGITTRKVYNGDSYGFEFPEGNGVGAFQPEITTGTFIIVEKFKTYINTVNTIYYPASVLTNNFEFTIRVIAGTATFSSTSFIFYSGDNVILRYFSGVWTVFNLNNPTLNVLPKKGASGFLDSAISEDATNILSAKVLRLAAGLTAVNEQDLTTLGQVNTALNLKNPLISHLEFNNTDLTVWNNGKGNISSNTSFGDGALRSNTTGSNNNANGLDALRSNTTGSTNTASGVNTLRLNTTGSNNTANGVSALQSNTTGSFNTANGLSALQSNTTGGFNTANGLSALQSNTTGVRNTANGVSALFSNTTGVNNIASGLNSGRFISDGSTSNTNSNSSLFFGNETKALADNQTNQIVIGDSAIGAGSNSVTLGNTNITKTVLRGDVETNGLIKLGQFTTATEPAYVKGASFFNTTLNKMRIGGATAYETVTSS